MRPTALLLILALAECSGLEARELVGPPAPKPQADALLAARGRRSETEQIAQDAAILTVAAAFDVGTKLYGLDACSGCYERNPIFRAEDGGLRTNRALAAKAATSAGAVYMAHRFREAGHKNAAQATVLGVAGAWIIAGFVNLAHAH